MQDIAVSTRFPASHQVEYLGGLSNDAFATVRIDGLVVQFCRFKGSPQHIRMMQLKEIESRRCQYLLPITYLSDQHIRLTTFLVSGRQSIYGSVPMMKRRLALAGRPYICDVRPPNIFWTLAGPVMTDFGIAEDIAIQYPHGVSLLRSTGVHVPPLHDLRHSVDLLSFGSTESNAVVRVDGWVYRLLKDPPRQQREQHEAHQSLKAAESRSHPLLNPTWYCPSRNAVVSRFLDGKPGATSDAVLLRKLLADDGRPYIRDIKTKMGNNIVVTESGPILIDFSINEEWRNIVLANAT